MIYNLHMIYICYLQTTHSLQILPAIYALIHPGQTYFREHVTHRDNCHAKASIKGRLSHGILITKEDPKPATCHPE